MNVIITFRSGSKADCYDGKCLITKGKLESFFVKKRDLQIADALLELFRRAEYIENFNKKGLYLLIREMTGYPTHYITKIVNKMKDKQMQLYSEFDSTGDIKI